MRQRRRNAFEGLARIALLCATGCQWITGAKERTLIAAGCHGDDECAADFRCLATRAGNQCQTFQQTQCLSAPAGSAGADVASGCPDGTICTQNQCRTVCGIADSLPCLQGQACQGAVCVGNDPSHDPSGSGASGGQAGTGNEAGSSSGGGLSAGGATGGSATGGLAGSGASAGTGTDCTNEGQVVNNVRTDDCIQYICQNGRVTLVADDGEMPTQAANDCKELVCQNMNVVIQNDPLDLPVDGNPCTKDLCTGMIPSNPNEVDGKTCPGGTCTNGACTGQCSNGRKDPGEADIDCGGTCGPCEDGKSCTEGAQCSLGICTGCANNICDTCSSSTPCASGGACGSAPLVIPDVCYILLIRNGAVMEASSSQKVCDDALPVQRPRAGDVIFVYNKHHAGDSANHNTVAVQQDASFRAPNLWFSRCAANNLASRDAMLAELNSNWGTGIVTMTEFFLGMSANCADAVYKMEF